MSKHSFSSCTGIYFYFLWNLRTLRQISVPVQSLDRDVLLRNTHSSLHIPSFSTRPQALPETLHTKCVFSGPFTTEACLDKHHNCIDRSAETMNLSTAHVWLLAERDALLLDIVCNYVNLPYRPWMFEIDTDERLNFSLILWHSLVLVHCPCKSDLLKWWSLVELFPASGATKHYSTTHSCVKFRRNFNLTIWCHLRKIIQIISPGTRMRNRPDWNYTKILGRFQNDYIQS